MFKTKYIERYWISTNNQELIDNTIGYVNKEMGTVQIMVSPELSITLNKNDVKANEEKGTLNIGIKKHTQNGNTTINVYNKLGKENIPQEREKVVNALIENGFELSKTEKLTGFQKLNLLN